MSLVIRRSVATVVAGLTLASGAAIALAPAAGADTPTPVAPGTLTFANTDTAKTVTFSDQLPSAVYTAGATVELIGPGANGTDDYVGTGTTVTGAGTCPPAPLPQLCTASTIQTTFDLDPGTAPNTLPAGPGSYTLSVTPGPTNATMQPNPADETTVTVTGDAPAPTALSTKSVAAGATAVAEKLTGTGFSKGDTVTASNTGITFTPASPQGTATELDGTVAVASTVPAGDYDLTVTDTAGKTGVCTKCLTVTTGGGGGGGGGTTGTTGVTSGDPLSNTATAAVVVIQDPTPSVAFVAGATAQLFGPGATGTDVIDATTTTTAAGDSTTNPTGSTVTATFDLDPSGVPAGPGAYTLSVTPGNTAQTMANPLDEYPVTVTGTAPAPTAVSPASVQQGKKSQGVVITGAHFANHDTLTASNTGITFTGVTVASAASIGATESVDAATPPGSYDLTVTDSDNQTGVCSKCLVVTGPTITSVSPTTSVKPGATVTVTGTDFKTGLTVTLTNGSTSTSPTPVTLSSDGTTATFTVPDSLATAHYDVTVTNTDGGTATKTAVLSVDNGPAAVTDLTAKAIVTAKATASFTQPDSPEAVTGYDVHVSSTSSTPTASDSGVTSTVTTTSSGGTIVIRGLTAATSYHLAVVPKNSSGTTGAATYTSFITPYPTTLTLSSSASHIVAGTAITVSGKLTRTVSGAAVPLSSKTVVIYGRLDSGKLVQITTATTTTTGTYSSTFKPVVDATILAAFFGSPSSGTTPGDAVTGSTSRPRTTVAPHITATPNHKKTSHRSALVVTGTVSPNEKNRTVVLDRIDSSGTLHTVAKAVLSGSSSYRISTTKLAKGTYTLVVAITKRSGNTSGRSKRFTVVRT